MKIYYQTKNEHRLRELQEVAREFSESIKLEIHNNSENELTSSYKIVEDTSLTVEGNKYYVEAITDLNDTPSLVDEILNFWSTKINNADRYCNLSTILFIGPINSDMIENPKDFKDFGATFRAFLLEQSFDKEYGGINLTGVKIGYDLDILLYHKETNRTLSTMTKEQRDRFSPRKKAMRKLIKDMFIKDGK